VCSSDLDEVRGTAQRLLGEGGLAMWRGQERDLCAAESPCSVEEAVTIAIDKSGEELAFVLQAAALIARAEINVSGG